MNTHGPRKPHPANVQGDFYVEDGCCLSCGVPEGEAPGNFAWVKEPYHHCFIARQPQTPEELERVINALVASDLSCIRYRGDDPDILRRIVAGGGRSECDSTLAPHVKYVVRSHVSFDLDAAAPVARTVQAVAESLRGHVLSRRYPTADRRPFYRAQLVPNGFSSCVLELTWPNEDGLYQAVEFSTSGKGYLAVCKTSHAGAMWSVSGIVDTWLQASGGFDRVRWFTPDEWQAGGPGQARFV